MDITKLSNGKEVAAPLVKTTLINAEALEKNDYIAFFELISLAKDPKHSLFPGAQEFLDSFALTCDGVMHDDVRAILDAAYELQGLGITRKNPVAA